MKTKILSLCLSFLVIVTACPVTVFAADGGANLPDLGVKADAATIVFSGKCGYNLTWTLDTKGTLTISGKGYMKNFRQFNVGYGYTDYAPWKNKKIVNVIIEDGVTSIGEYAFYGCGSLTNITIPDSVTSIGDRAFSDCGSLTNITIPDSVTSIGDRAFSGFTGLTSITIPDSVTGIGWGAFSDCSNLTSITIPDSVTSIDNDAFARCSSLTSITIPDSVTSIGAYTFCECSSLTNITIPDGVTSIGSCAFSSCSSLTSITIPDGVTSIGSYAFNRCSSLTSITIPDGVTSIDDYTFYECSSLTSITIPDSVTIIGEKAFYGCTGLTSISVPDSVTSIGDRAFYDVANVSYNGSATGWWGEKTLNGYIEDGIVYKNADKKVLTVCPTSRTGDVVIPAGVTSIGDGAFEYCAGLTSITISDSVTSIGYGAFKDCGSLTSITLPDGVTSIDNYAFDGCTGLTSITIPDSVTSICYGVFYGCSSLTSVTIPDSVTSIGGSAFSGCSSLTSISVPDSVTSIGEYAFSGCTGLTSISVPDSVTFIGDGAFSYVANVSYTGSASSWLGDYTGMAPRWWGARTLNGYIEDGLVYRNSEKTELTACPTSRTGDVIIPAGVTRIWGSAFKDCTGITSITIPDSVTEIYAGAFFNTAFYNNEDNWEDGVLYCGKFLIEAKEEIKGEYAVKNGTRVIANYAFYHCTDLTRVTIPVGVTTIGESAFEGCTGLTSISVPDSVTSIGYMAFYDFIHLVDIYFNNPNCKIIDHENAIDKHAVIHGYRWSTAQEYAKKYGRTFVEIPHQHSFKSEVTKEADCTHGGVKTFTCTDENCGYSYTEEIPTKGHVEGEPVAENIVGAICTDAGSYDSVIRCSVCNEELSREKKNVNALGHDEIEHEAKAATCTEEGNNAYVTCSRCDYTTFEEMPALGHKEEKISAVAPTCTKTGLSEGKRCSRCGIVLVAQKEIGKVAHKWDAGKVTKPAAVGVKGVKTFTCTVCKATRTEDIPALTPAAPKAVEVKTTEKAKTLSSGFVGATHSVTVAELLAASNASYVVDKDGKKLTDTSKPLATGMKLVLESNGKKVEKVIAVLGDIDGNGEMAVTDARLALRAAVGLDELKGAYLDAAKVGGSEKVEVSDARLILRAAVQLETGKDWLGKVK